MAVEPQIHPPEPPFTRPRSTATATATATETAAEAPTSTTALPYADSPGPSLASKRQRRPSVRLGEIRDQRAMLVHDSHARRPSIPPWNWSLPKDSSAAKATQTRSFTNFAMVGADSHDIQDFELPNNLYAEFGSRKRAKPKQHSTRKRVRSNWVPRTDDGAEGDSREDEDEGFRDFDPDHSPVHSVRDVGFDSWHFGWRKVSEAPGSGNLPESDSDDQKYRRSKGVKSWLIKLGLSRYAPMFEIHEVDDELLPMLTLEDLKDMGISAVGSRRKLYTAIQKLRRGFP